MTIRDMRLQDGQIILDMMRVFYASPAVLSNGSEEIFRADVQACIEDNPYLQGFVMELDGEIIGYSMVAKSFSTEFGKRCIWIEDLYVLPEHRHKGYGSRMLQYVARSFPGCLLRLEVEAENEKAIAAYRKNGFEVLPYMEMKK